MRVVTHTHGERTESLALSALCVCVTSRSPHDLKAEAGRVRARRFGRVSPSPLRARRACALTRAPHVLLRQAVTGRCFTPLERSPAARRSRLRAIPCVLPGFISPGLHPDAIRTQHVRQLLLAACDARNSLCGLAASHLSRSSTRQSFTLEHGRSTLGCRVPTASVWNGRGSVTRVRRGADRFFYGDALKRRLLKRLGYVKSYASCASYPP